MPIDLNQDYQDLINCLTHQSVEFIVVGAHALAFHGVARYTADLDLWINRTSQNSSRLQRALEEFGIRVSDSDIEALTHERRFLRFGVEPRRIEILNFLDGCEFETAAARSIKEELGEKPVQILGLEDYVATKRASGRPKDLSDLILLESVIGPLPKL